MASANGAGHVHQVCPGGDGILSKQGQVLTRREGEKVREDYIVLCEVCRRKVSADPIQQHLEACHKAGSTTKAPKGRKKRKHEIAIWSKKGPGLQVTHPPPVQGGSPGSGKRR